MKSDLKSLAAFIKAQYNRRIRNKRFLVWVIIMPILLIGFLNVIWGDEGVTAHVAVLDKDESGISNTTMALLKSQKKLDIVEVDSLEEGVDLINRGKVEALLVMPDNFSDKWDEISQGRQSESIEFQVYYASGSEEEELINIVLKGITSDINEWILDDGADKPVEITTRSLETRKWTYSDLLLPGGIIIILLQIGIFSSSNNSSALYENKLNKRLWISPSPVIYSISGMVLLDSMFTMLSGIIGLITGLVLFDIAMPIINFLALIPFLFIGSLVFTYIGYIIGKFSHSQNSAQGLSSMIVFPLIFFSEAYLFSNIFPEYVIDVAELLPVGPIVAKMKSLLFYSPSTMDYLGEMGILLLWLGVIFTMCVFIERDSL